jgi:hypothetical protein
MKIQLDLTVEKAREYYNSGNSELASIALKAFTMNELFPEHWKEIKTFVDVLKELGYSNDDYLAHKKGLSQCPNYTHLLALYRVDLIRKALNDKWKPLLTAGIVYIPRLFFYDNLSAAKLKVEEAGDSYVCICEQFTYIDVMHYLVGGCITWINSGISNYQWNSSADIELGLFCCKSREIAKHMSRYFAKDIFDAMYIQHNNYKWTNEEGIIC